MTVRIPTVRGLTTTIDLVVQFRNLPRGRAAAAQARRAVTLARTRRVVRRGGRLTLRLRYTKAGRALIRRRKRLEATIRVVTTVQGRAPATTSQTVTLRARR